jgi:hypothetical protein
MIYKALHKTLKIEQHESHKNGMNPCPPEGLNFPALFKQRNCSFLLNLSCVWLDRKIIMVSVTAVSFFGEGKPSNQRKPRTETINKNYIEICFVLGSYME